MKRIRLAAVIAGMLFLMFQPALPGPVTLDIPTGVAQNDSDGDGVPDSIDACHNPIAPAGLVSYWGLGDGSGPTAVDSYDGNPGTLYGGPVWTTGEVGGALSFDGVDDYVRVPDSSSLDVSSAATVESWIRLSSLDKHQKVVMKGSGEGTNWSYWLAVTDTNVVWWHLFLSSHLNSVYSSTVLQADEWYHIVGTFSGQNQEMRIYVNGEFEGSATGDGASISDSSHPLFIGAELTSGSMIDYLDGVADEIAIYDRALGPAEIKAHYNGGLVGMGYCAAVGGVAELPDVASQGLATDDRSGGVGLVTWLAATIAVSAIVLGGAAWYARRRWLG